MNRFFTAMLTAWPELREVPTTGIECFKTFEDRLANVTSRAFNEQMVVLSLDVPSIEGFTYMEAYKIIDNIKPIEFGAVFAQHLARIPPQKPISVAA